MGRVLDNSSSSVRDWSTGSKKRPVRPEFSSAGVEPYFPGALDLVSGSRRGKGVLGEGQMAGGRGDVLLSPF